MGKFLRFLISMAVLMAFYGAGEVLVRLLGIPFPGSVVGMVMLVFALMNGWIDVRRVEAFADFILSYLGMLFVPPAVAIMLYTGLIAADWLPLLAGTVLSLVAVLWSTALTARLLMKGEEHD
jgi:holin-like protein